jgi:signal transduction histidine kinase/CheY-like chemotaxis protein
LLLAALYTIVRNNLGGGDITQAIHAMQIGFALQQVFLSIGLAQQVNTLKEAKAIHEQESRIAKAESSAKSEFLARMSHEIRTPMNAVLGITQLLSDSPLNAEQRQQVALLYSSGTQLLELINDILDFSRISADKLTLEEVSFDLPVLLNECVNLFQANALQKSLTLTYEAPEDLPRWLLGDPVRIRQILFNLLGNSLKFTQVGYVHLTVQVLSKDAENCQLRFSVQDSGIGMSTEQLQRLFTAFTQADTTITRQYGGSGLGLAISKQLVELMGGTISVSSELGIGSNFVFDVTLKLSIAPALSMAPLQELKPRPSLTQLRVLVAEDSHINQVVIRTMLQRFAINPVMVTNGAEAINILTSQHERFDLVLMDYEMPVQDGLVTVRQLRQWEELHQRPRLPVIALTAHALPQYEQLCREAGMDDFLSKPILLQQLFAKLEQFHPPSAS